MRHNQKGFAIIPVVIVIAVLAVGGWFVWQKGGVTTQAPDGWKTYRNEKYGFEVKYPSDWHIAQTEPIVVLRDKKTADKETTLPGISIRTHSNEARLSAKDWWLDYIKGFGDSAELISNTTRQDITLPIGPTYRVRTSGSWTSIPFDSTFISRNDKIYEITAVFGSEDIYSKILSTFKFIK